MIPSLESHQSSAEAFLLSLIRCPACGSDQFKLHSFQSNQEGTECGLISCTACRAWYPIVDFIPVLSLNSVLVRDIKQRLISTWAHEFDFSVLSAHEIRLDPTQEDLQQSQIDHFNHEADHYDEEIPNTTFWKAMYAKTVESWAYSHLSSVDPVLEIGCGTGVTSVALMQAGHQVVGIDISLSVAKKAREKLRALKLNPVIIVTEAENLPFKPNTFNSAVFTGVLHHVAEPEKVLLEIGKVLKPGAQFFGFENNATVFRWIFDLLMKWKRLWHEEAGSHPLIKAEDAKRWASAAKITIETSTSVFLPPHFFNYFPLKIAQKMLAFTDHLFGSIPILKHHGGLIILSGIKSPADAKSESPEFNQFADHYHSEVDGWLKRFASTSALYVAKAKADHVIFEAQHHFTNKTSLTGLDVGCGTGLIASMIHDDTGIKILGTDLSQGMIDHRVESSQKIELLTSNSARLPFKNDCFDFSYSVCFFHHLDDEDRLNTVQEMKRVTKPEGLIFIFEHNPYNPIVQAMVKCCPLDRNARLLTPNQVKQLYQQAGIEIITLKFILFFPEPLSFLNPLQTRLSRLPLGSQYFVLGRKSN